MSNEKLKWIEEHKDFFAAFAVSAVTTTVAMAVGYKIGKTRLRSRMESRVGEIFQDFLPELIDRAGFLGFANTMELIDDTVPEAGDMIVKHFGNSQGAVTKAVAHRFFTDPEIKEAMEFIKELSR